MVATPDFGGETYDDSEPLTGSDKALGLVGFSVFPHVERVPDTSLANIEKNGPPGYRCRRTRSTMTPR